MKAFGLLLIGLVGAAVSAAMAAPPPAATPAAWARCAICHANTRGGAAEIGPNLWGVAGAKAGARPGFAYSAALKKTGLVWNKANLTKWLANTQGLAPGSTMPNQALKPAERDALVNYLLTLK